MRLDEQGVTNSGIIEDESGLHLNAKDPDNIALEFFYMPGPVEKPEGRKKAVAGAEIEMMPEGKGSTFEPEEDTEVELSLTEALDTRRGLRRREAVRVPTLSVSSIRTARRALAIHLERHRANQPEPSAVRRRTGSERLRPHNSVNHRCYADDGDQGGEHGKGAGRD